MSNTISISSDEEDCENPGKRQGSDEEISDRVVKKQKLSPDEKIILIEDDIDDTTNDPVTNGHCKNEADGVPDLSKLEDSEDSVVLIDDQLDEPNIETNDKPVDNNEVEKKKKIIPVTLSSKSSIVLCGDDEMPTTSKDSAYLNIENGLLTVNPEETDPYKETVEDFGKNLKELMEYCEKLTKTKELQDKFSDKSKITLKIFNTVVSQKKDLVLLNETLISKLEDLKENPKNAVIYYKDIHTELQLLKSQKLNGNPETDKKLKQLWKALHKCEQKIKSLEEAEVDWSDDEDSIYIQEGRYKDRAAKIYKYICKLTNQNYNTINPLCKKLDFDHSMYPEVNKAINKKFKDNSVFPDFPQMLRCVQKCVEKNGLKLSKIEVENEARRCFLHLGKLLQKRRQCDFRLSLFSMAPIQEDPITSNPELVELLEKSSVNFEQKEKELFDTYVNLQESGQDKPISEDSDDSNVKESDSESG